MSTNQNDNLDLLANSLLGGLKDILTKPLPGTARPDEQTDAEAPSDVDADDETVLERIKEILTAPLPGTKDVRPTAKRPEQKVDAPTEPKAERPVVDQPDDEPDERVLEHDWEAMKRRHEQEREGMKRRHEREREEMKRQRERAREARKRAKERDKRN